MSIKPRVLSNIPLREGRYESLTSGMVTITTNDRKSDNQYADIIYVKGLGTGALLMNANARSEQNVDLLTSHAS